MQWIDQAAVMVSIRAPAWGATKRGFFVSRLSAVSIRAPAWGATHGGQSRSLVQSRFNSRSRVGSDGGYTTRRRRIQVSIRAPAWGATLSWCNVWQHFGFNSRSRVGSDSQTLATASADTCFNSRSRVGSDVEVAIFDIDGIVSIRAPAWGATSFASSVGHFQQFQFALPRGERRITPPLLSKPKGFNSRSRVGSDGALAGRDTALCGFNSRSRVGSDLLR